MIGLGVMGSNLALNVADHGFRVAVWNREPENDREVLRGEPGQAAHRDDDAARTSSRRSSGRAGS